MSTQFSLLITK